MSKQPFLFSFDPDTDTCRTIMVDRETLSTSSFLDERMLSDGIEFKTTPLSDSIKNTPAKSGRTPHFIFHSAFCCSTLMARLLDVPGSVLSLKEPQITADLARTLQQQPHRTDFADLFRTFFATLDQPFVGDEQTLIKPTNLANGILPGVVQCLPDAKILFMYSSLREFMISIIKKGEAGRRFARMVFDNCAGETGFYQVVPERRALGWTDLQIAALAWHLQIDYARKIIAQFGNDRFRTLHHKTLLAEPEETLCRANDFFNFGLSDADIKAAATGPAMQKDSKVGSEFSAEKIAEDSASIEARFGGTLDTIMDWTKSFSMFQPHDADMPVPL